MKKRYIFAIIIIIIGILMFFAPHHIAHVCPPKADGSFMKCHWMAEAVRMLGGLVVFMGIFFALFETFAKGIALSAMFVGICQILLQFVVIGTCKTPTMSCNIYTKPTIILLSAILIITSFVYIYLTRKEK